MIDIPQTIPLSSGCDDRERLRWCPIAGFSLLELLVAMAVLSLMAVMMLSVTSSAQRLARQTFSRVEQVREARRAFERINQTLSQATLNSYWDYVDSSGKPRANASFTPANYFRLSELRYLQTNASQLTAPHGGTLAGKAVFFQAPLGKSDSVSGLNSLLNTVGFFIERGSDSSMRPTTVTATKARYRLFELLEPTEKLTIYSLTSGNSTYTGTAWFTTPLTTAAYSHRLADNIVALVFQAQYTAANAAATNSFDYSSSPQGNTSQAIEENNLPPNVRVTMIAVDENSARRIQDLGLSLTDARNDTDLGTLETELKNNNLNYRKFESDVSIGPAKWSAK